jgi:hypothetical protein
VTHATYNISPRNYPGDTEQKLSSVVKSLPFERVVKYYSPPRLSGYGKKRVL